MVETGEAAPRTLEEQSAIKEAEEVAQLLQNLSGKGYQVGIFRKAPAWCQGFCDTWPLDEPLSLTELRDTWGGHKFLLQIWRPGGDYYTSRTVRIDDVPKRWGRPVTRDEILEEKRAELFQMPQPGQRQQGHGIDGDESTLRFLLKFMQEQAAAQVELIRSMAAEKVERVNPLQQMQEAAQMIGALRELAETFSPGGDGNTDGLSIAKLFLTELADRKTKAQTQSAPPARRRPPPGLPPAPRAAAADPAPAVAGDPGEGGAAPPPTRNPSPPPAAPPEDSAEDLDDEPETLAEELSTLEPEEAAETIKEVFENWTEAERKRALAVLFDGDPEALINSVVGGTPAEKGSEE